VQATTVAVHCLLSPLALHSCYTARDKITEIAMVCAASNYYLLVTSCILTV